MRLDGKDGIVVAAVRGMGNTSGYPGRYNPQFLDVNILNTEVATYLSQQDSSGTDCKQCCTHNSCR